MNETERYDVKVLTDILLWWIIKYCLYKEQQLTHKMSTLVLYLYRGTFGNVIQFSWNTL